MEVAVELRDAGVEGGAVVRCGERFCPVLEALPHEFTR
jgi:hypothetical protein